MWLGGAYLGGPPTQAEPSHHIPSARPERRPEPLGTAAHHSYMGTEGRPEDPFNNFPSPFGSLLCFGGKLGCERVL